MRKINNIKRAMLCGAVTAVTFPLAGYAQTASEDGGIREIVVTAQKRAEPLQEVPIAVTALDAGLIEDRGITNLAGITQMVPNAQIGSGFVNPTQIAPFIRGIGTHNSDPLTTSPIAVSVDGVYLSTVFGALINTFDVEQVEVLRGPQGTLQGRSATGGAINVRSRRPADELGIRAEVGFGRFNKFTAMGSIEGPLIPDVLMAKVAIIRENGGNYQKNLTNGHDAGGVDQWAGRAGLLFTPNERMTFYATADFVSGDNPQPSTRAANIGTAIARPEYPSQPLTLACSGYGVCTPDEKWTTRANYTRPTKTRSRGFSLNADFEMGAATITSVTGYRILEEYNSWDADQTEFQIFEQIRPNYFTEVEDFSQELRIASTDDGGADFGGHVKWLFGAYYLNNKIYKKQNFHLNGNPLPNNTNDQTLDTWAVFGHIDIKPIDDLTVYVGGRQTWDKKNISILSPVPGEGVDRWSNFSMEAGVNYQIARDKMVYARYSEGYIPGGFTSQRDAATGEAVRFASETLDSYEIGFKTDWLGRRLRLNGAAFQYKYKGIQRDSTRQVDIPPFFVSTPTNIGDATLKGVELEMTALPVNGLTIMGSVGYLDTKYDRFDRAVVVGDELVIFDNRNLRFLKASKWTASADIQYEIPLAGGSNGKITPAANMYYKSSHTVDTDDSPVGNQKGYTLFNAWLRYTDPSDTYKVTAFIDNITNKHYIVASATLAGFGLVQNDAAPRTYGIRFAASW